MQMLRRAGRAGHPAVRATRLYPALGELAASTFGVEAPTYDIVAVDELGMLARRAVHSREVRAAVGQAHACLGLHLANVGRLGDGGHRPNVSLRSPHGPFCHFSSRQQEASRSLGRPRPVDGRANESRFRSTLTPELPRWT